MAIHKIKAGQIPTVNAATYVGEKGVIFYDSTGFLRLSDGHTPGGIPITAGFTNPFTQILTITNTTVSLGTDSGALTVAGGVGIGGDLYVGGKIVGGGVRSTSTSTAPTSPLPTVGDIWYDTATDAVYRYTSDGINSYWLDITGSAVSSGGGGQGGGGNGYSGSTGYVGSSGTQGPAGYTGSSGGGGGGNGYTGSTGYIGSSGAVGQLDGGQPNTVYGGVSPIDAGGVTG